MRIVPRFLALLCLLAEAGALRAENWPQWRGPRMDGTSLEAGAPVTWSATENVLWKTELPGSGHASPIVWGERVFTVSCNEESGERLLLCLDRKSGALLWKSVVLVSPLERIHKLNSHASSTPATDGERVFSTFLDKDQVVVAAHDFSGKALWLKRPGTFASEHGFCSSPLVYADKVIVNCDQDGEGFIVALARSDGRELWRIARPNQTRSYCVPLIREAGGRRQMVLSGSKCVASYDPDTGKELWMMDGPTEQFVASLVYSEQAKLFFLTAGYPKHHLLAIRPGVSGKVADEAIAWRTTRGAAYVPSPIAIGPWFLVVSDSGVLHCYGAADGQLAWQQRLGEEHASPVSAGGLVYFPNDQGVTHVVRPGTQYELVAANELGERVFSSPALSEGQFFFRGEHSLFCIGVRAAR